MEDLTWGANTGGEVVMKAKQRLYFLSVFRKNNIPPKLLVSFYRCSIENILTYCLCMWFSSCVVAQTKTLKRVIKDARGIIGCPLPSLEELLSTVFCVFIDCLLCALLIIFLCYILYYIFIFYFIIYYHPFFICWH